MSFKHYVITRFNLSQRWDVDKFGHKVQDEAWLKKRFQLFEDYCFPSVKSQTQKDFEWWVFFDANTPKQYLEKIKTYESQCSNFKAKFKSSYQAFDDTLGEDIYNAVKDANVDFVITTRLDNDDVLAKTAVQVLQNNVVDYKCVLDLPIGYNLQLGSKTALRKMNCILGPFISLLEKFDKNATLDTVYKFQHGQWTHEKHIVVSEQPQWIQVIHDGNVFNQIKGKEVLTYGALRNFQFKTIKFSHKNNFNLIKRNIKKQIKRILKLR